MEFAAPAYLERYRNTAMSAPAGFADNFDRVFGRVDANGFPANNTLRSCKRGPGSGALNFYHGVSFLELGHLLHDDRHFILILVPSYLIVLTPDLVRK